MKHAVAIAIVSAALAAPAWAADDAAQLNAQELARIGSGAPATPPMTSPPVAATACPPGSHLVPEGYIKRAKWRPAGCVRGR